VPWTSDLSGLNVAFRERSATVRAGIANGIVSSLHIEERYFLAFDCERRRLAGGTSLASAILKRFAIIA
jgi:hypothetical protein